MAVCLSFLQCMQLSGRRHRLGRGGKAAATHHGCACMFLVDATCDQHLMLGCRTARAGSGSPGETTGTARKGRPWATAPCRLMKLRQNMQAEDGWWGGQWEKAGRSCDTASNACSWDAADKAGSRRKGYKASQQEPAVQMLASCDVCRTRKSR